MAFGRVSQSSLTRKAPVLVSNPPGGRDIGGGPTPLPGWTIPTVGRQNEKGLEMTDDRRQWAIGRVRAKRAFWVHLSVYILVNAFLVVVWAASSAGYFWPVWPMLGWGIGVAAHALSVFLAPTEVSEERIDRELQGRRGSSTNTRAGRG